MEITHRKDRSQDLPNIHQIIFPFQKNANIKLILLKALIRSVTTYACPAWEYAAESHLLELQRLQNRVLHITGNIPRCTSVRDMHVALQIPYVYDCIKNFAGSRQQAEDIQNHDNENVRNIGQGEGRHRKYKRLKLGDSHV
jgi:hypothetical protein